MAEPQNTGLEADIGVKLGKITKQLAAAEARALRAAKKIEGDFANSNTKIVRSFQQVEKAQSSAFNGQGLRQASLQLSQVAQQGAATGNYLQALAIQLPDLALGFGTIGIFAGIAAGALLPLVGSFLGASDSAEDLKNRMKALKDLADGLDASLDLLKLSAGELATKYGEAAERVRGFALAQAELRVDQANARLNEQASILRDMTTEYITSSESGSRFEKTIGRISEAFGVGRNEAIQLEGAFQSLYQAQTFSDQQAALENVLSLMRETGALAGDLPPEFSAALDEMIDLSNETDAARELMNRLSYAADVVASSISGAATQASILAANAYSAVDAFNAASRAQYQASGVYGQVGARGDPRQFGNGPTPQLGEESRNLIAAADKRAAKGRRGGGGGSKKPYEPVSAQEDIDRLTRQIEMIGKTDAAIAAMTARYKLLDEAKKRGLDLDKVQAGSSVTLRQEIEQQAKAIGDLTAKHDHLAESAQFYEGLQADLKDGFLDAVVAGESLSGVLADVAQAFAKAAFEAALFGTGPMSGGGGGNWLSTALNAWLGGGGKAPGVPSYAGGGFTGSGPRTGGLDGQGGYLAMLHPRETVLDHTRGQSAAGGGAPSINVNVSGVSGDRQIMEAVQKGVREGLSQYDRTLPVRFNQIAQHPRKR